MSSFVKNLVTRRNFAAQASTAVKQTNYSLPHHQPEVSSISNGAVVASLENNYPISKIGVFVKSGSKYETSSNYGASQIIRAASSESSANFTGFKLTKLTQQLGGELVCESGREYISYGLTINRDEISQGFEMLVDAALNPAFKPWEVPTLNDRVLTELELRTPSAIAIDLLHKAAYRSAGLGNSLFIPKYQVGKLTPEQLRNFVATTHTGPRIAYVGIGIEHSALKLLAKSITPRTGDLTEPASVYGAGDVREIGPGSLAYVAVAGPGAKLGSDEAVSLAIAQFILGAAPGLKNGSNPSSKLASFISSAGGTGAAYPINVNYTDSGLFGFILTEQGDKAGDVVRAIVKGLRSIKISEADVTVGKAKATAALLQAQDSLDSEFEDMGLQALFTGNYVSPNSVAEAIGKVTAASVQSALSNALKGKGSLGAYGAISNIPYLDQL